MTDTDLQQRRLIAAAIDIAIVFVVIFGVGIGQFIIGMVLGHGGGMATHVVLSGLQFVGSVLILGFILLRDIVAGDRSLGKKFQDIRVVDSGNRPIEMMDSVKRNLIFSIGSILGTISAAIGLLPCVGAMVNCLLLPLMFVGAFVGLVAVIVEIVKIFQDPNGIRFGDGFAGTRVVR